MESVAMGCATWLQDAAAVHLLGHSQQTTTAHFLYFIIVQLTWIVSMDTAILLRAVVSVLLGGMAMIAGLNAPLGFFVLVKGQLVPVPLDFIRLELAWWTR
jgi:hypothetical protein